MRRFTIVLSLVAGLGLTSCGDVLVDDEQSRTPAEYLDMIWSQIDRHYALFSVRDVDWDSIRTVYTGLASPHLSDLHLYDLACKMIRELQDGHVNIFSPFGTCGYDEWRTRYPDNFSLGDVLETHLKGAYSFTPGGRLIYGKLDGNIGYLHISSFAGRDWVDSVDVVLKALGPVSAMVVDVRGNGGGSGTSAAEVAGRFADQKRVYAYYRYRNGPAHDDFTDPAPLYVEPEGNSRFRGPVVVLTNRSCFSACESFVMAMRTIPGVRTIGDTTGGGLGNPVYRELPNGWTYRIPVWMQTGTNGEMYEGTGIPPDIFERIRVTDAWLHIDTILVRAMAVLTAMVEQSNLR